MINYLKYLVVVILIVAMISSCAKKENPDYDAVASGEIRIGVLLSLTGGGFSTGQSTRVSLEIARGDILAYLNTLRIDKKITLEMTDTKTDTAEALKQLKIMYGKGIRLVIGPFSSAELGAIKNYADTHDMLLVSPSSVAVSLAIPGDNVFRFVSTDVIQGKAMRTLLVQDSMKVIVPLVRDDLWGRDLLASTRKDFEESGGRVHTPVLYPPNTTDFGAFLAELDGNTAEELLSYNPGEVAVYLIALGEGSDFLAQSNNYPDLSLVRWYGSSAFAQNASVFSDTTAAFFAKNHGFPCPVYGLDESAKNKWQPLVDRIRMQTGRVPEVYAITAYDACWVAVLTYLKTGSYPSVSFLKSVFTQEAGNFFGASGNTSLDVNGDRATGNYDFWAVERNLQGYTWKIVARYNSVTGVLIRVGK